jgi:hypothetical protein
MAKPKNNVCVKKSDIDDTDSNEKDLETVSSLSTKPSENGSEISKDNINDNCQNVVPKPPAPLAQASDHSSTSTINDDRGSDRKSEEV